MNFNKEQLEAINTIDGMVQVIAAAGSGKTATIMGRISHLVNDLNVDQRDILAISFTNASASDLKDKLIKNSLPNVSVGTFHGVSKVILEGNGYENLMNFPNQYKLKREIETTLEIRNLNLADVLGWIGYQKAYELTPYSERFKSKESNYEIYNLINSFKIYEEFKTRTNTYDFTDWLILCKKLYENGGGRKWKYVLVDEAMDSNLLQTKLAEHFCEGNNLYIVGDFSQSLYSFNAAVPELFKNFPKTHPETKVINMNTNYRSCKNIVEAANEFILPYNIDYKHYKPAYASNRNNGIIKTKLAQDSYDEAEWVIKKIQDLMDDGEDLNDIAVLYRNHSCSDILETYLKDNEIPYKVFNNNSFFEKNEIKNIIAILRLSQSLEDDEAFETLLKSRMYPTTFFKGNLIDELRVESGKKDCSMYEALLDHNFDKPWDIRNVDTLSEYLTRIKMQINKHLSLDKVINNIFKMFKIQDWLFEKYTPSTIEDKMSSINNLKSIAKDKNIGTLLILCENKIKTDNKKNGIELRTFHNSKGLEYKITFVIGLEEKKFPSERSDEGEEARLMYVATTRAKEQLYLSSIGISTFYNQYIKGLDKINKEI